MDAMSTKMTNNSQLMKADQKDGGFNSNTRKRDFNLNVGQSIQSLENLSFRFELEIAE